MHKIKAPNSGMEYIWFLGNFAIPYISWLNEDIPLYLLPEVTQIRIKKERGVAQ